MELYVLGVVSAAALKASIGLNTTIIINSHFGGIL
jgi:hypothetical protein